MSPKNAQEVVRFVEVAVDFTQQRLEVFFGINRQTFENIRGRAEQFRVSALTELQPMND
jgi:hypothetical protein